MFTEKEISAKIIEWLVMPYNISLAIIAAILWCTITFLPFNANHSFDLISSVLNNITHFSSICLAGALIAKNLEVGYAAALSFIVAVFAMIFVKSVGFSSIGYMFFLPIALFRSLLVIKYICLAIAEKK